MKAWAMYDDVTGPPPSPDSGIVCAETRPKAMMVCVLSYCDAGWGSTAEAFRRIRLRRAPEYDHVADLAGKGCWTREYVDSVAAGGGV